MLVAVRPPRSGIARILGLPTAIIIVKGIPFLESAFGIFEPDSLDFPYIMIFSYRTNLVAIKEMKPPMTLAIAIPTNIPPLDLLAISRRALMSSRMAETSACKEAT